MIRRWPTILVLLLAVVVIAAAPASLLAAEEHAGKKPEPNIFDPRLDLTLWTILVFGVLLLVLWKFAWGPMLQGLQTREKLIHGAIEEAQRDRQEAERLRQEFQQQLDRAQEQVRGIMDEGRRTAQQTQEEMLTKARTEIQAERDRQRREIEIARDQALQELWNRTAQLATLISAKTLRRQISPDDQRRLVDEAMAELRETGDGKQNA